MADLGRAIIPYCGTPPSPASLAGRWNLDPVLIACLALIAAGYVWQAHRRGKETPALRQLAFYGGWLLTTLALISPLCPLSVSLFSARVGQHMILTVVAAPAVAFGLRLGEKRGGGGWLAHQLCDRPLAAAAAFAMLLWFWHSPTPYAETFRRTDVYWAMHLSLYGSALWLWCGLLRPGGSSSLRALSAGALSSIQMGFLGAILTLAPRVIFTPHLATAAAWGLSPLQDQQLGGALMWAPGGLAFFLVGAAGFWRLLSDRPGDAPGRPFAPVRA